MSEEEQAAQAAQERATALAAAQAAQQQAEAAQATAKQLQEAEAARQAEAAKKAAEEAAKVPDPPKDWKGSSDAWAETVKARRQREAAQQQAKDAQDALEQMKAETEQIKRDTAKQLEAMKVERERQAQDLALTRKGVTDPVAVRLLKRDFDDLKRQGAEVGDFDAWLASDEIQSSTFYSQFFGEPREVSGAPPNPNVKEGAVVLPPAGTRMSTHHLARIAQDPRLFQEHGQRALEQLEAQMGVPLVGNKDAIFGRRKRSKR